jgi:hypothetical protein
MSVATLACFAVGTRAATPIVSIGPTSSPTGGTALGTVSSGGEADACLDQQHSGANPSASSPSGVVQLADRSCAAPGGSGTPTTAAATTAGATTAGSGGSTQSSKSQTTSSRSTTVSRRAAGSSSSSSTRTAAAVWAGKARGLQITAVRSKLVQAKQGKRLRVLVTLRDRQRRLVRSAIVSIGGLAGAKSTLPRLRAGFTNRKGQAAFVVAVTKSMLGQRVPFRVGARTPTAQAHKVSTALVPKQRTRRKVIRHIAGG